MLSQRESGRGAGGEGVGCREGETSEEGRGLLRESHDCVVFCESGSDYVVF